MSTRPTPAPAPSTPAAAAVAIPSSAAPSEAPTILGSDDEEAAGPLPLQRRAPPVKMVIEAVMDCDALKPFLSLAARSIHEGDIKLFTGDAAMHVWEDVADKLCDGVEKYTPMHEKDLRKKTVAFAKYRQGILRDFVPSAASSIVNVDDDPKGPRSLNIMSLFVLIATYFIQYFLDMISAPAGDDIKPIQKSS